MKLIVGLGNKGPEYAEHRHNIGFWVVDQMAEERSLKWEDFSRLAKVAETTLSGEEVLLVKPMTFMNRSGVAVKSLLKEKGLTVENLMVVHDEIDLLLGQMRWVFGRGSGGNNGVQSIIESLGTKAFHRARIGVGRPGGKEEAADYVLRPFRKEEGVVAREMAVRVAESVAFFMKEGLEKTQSLYNQ